MSVLRTRIITHAGMGVDAGQYGSHPAGTAATPMVMPLAHISYDGYTALYGTLHPLVSADGAVIAAPSPAAVAAPFPAPVVPAGRA